MGGAIDYSCGAKTVHGKKAENSRM